LLLVCSFFKAKYNDLAMPQDSKTFEIQLAAQFAIHDVSTWAIKCTFLNCLALALIICLLQYPHYINYGVPLFCVCWPNKPFGLTGLAFESSLASPWLSDGSCGLANVLCK
jgi:hypothetical protein